MRQMVVIKINFFSDSTAICSRRLGLDREVDVGLGEVHRGRVMHTSFFHFEVVDHPLLAFPETVAATMAELVFIISL